MGKLPIDDPDCFRSHAEAARMMAAQMIDPEAKRMVIIVAETYERLAFIRLWRSGEKRAESKCPRGHFRSIGHTNNLII
jgi:hypothetical protein